MKNFFIPFYLLALLLMSCDAKLELENPVDPTLDPDRVDKETPKIKTISSGGDTSTLMYDVLGRQTQVTFSEGGKSEYEYFPDQVQRKGYQADGSLQSFAQYDLNADRLRSYGWLSQSGHEEYYTYNIANQVLTLSNITGNAILVQNHHYSHGNLDSIVYVKNNVLAYTCKYQYDLNKPNGLTREMEGIHFYGEESKNLLKSWKGVNKNGQTFIHVYFNYTFDEKNRVKTMTQFFNDSISIFEYTYY